MLSLLGTEMALGGHIIKPFYLLLGLLSFSFLALALGSAYFILYIKNTLVNRLNR
jgi:hypothetical protein